jgi:tRNA-specific 2-thiouridylase
MHVVVGISGGVDSAVTAWRLREAGHRVSGVFMVNWTDDDPAYCTSAEDFKAAQAVCEELDIPLQRVDFSAEYHERVFADFLRQYEAGRTPNPDILCNREIKFAPFLAHAERIGAEAVATGHYARLRHDADGPRLLRALDDNKDQTYFLAAVPRAAFTDVLFPIGDLTKPQVRELARSAGLPNFRRKDSTGICFIGERRMRDFLARYIHAQPGDIEDEQGRRIGRHAGLAYYTPGQRRGLSVGGVAGAADAPWYVIDRDPARNVLIVSQQSEHPRLMTDTLITAAPQWIRSPTEFPASLQARIRHRQSLQDCVVTASGESLRVHFAQAQRAAAAGQYVVFYDGEECLGGAEIDSV